MLLNGDTPLALRRENMNALEVYPYPPLDSGKKNEKIGSPVFFEGPS